MNVQTTKSFLKKLLDSALWIAAIVVVGLALWPKDSGPEPGSPSAHFELPIVGSTETFSHSGARKRPLLIKAFASWCSACKRSASSLPALAEAARKGKLDVVAVSVDDKAQKALAAKKNWPIRVPVLHDENGRFKEAYDIVSLPTFILINSDGQVADVKTGSPGASDLRRWLNPDG